MRFGVIPVVAFLVFAPASAADTCSSQGSCDRQEAEDDSFAAAQLRTFPRHRPGKPCKGNVNRTLGLLQLDGYYWPTQPGDVNDLRTWCNVTGIDGSDYKCNSTKAHGEDEFGLSIATIEGGYWELIQKGTMDNLTEAFTRAVEHHLLDPNVHAIMGNTGWFTWYQYNVSEIMLHLVNDYKKKGKTLKMKPWLGGAPAMLAAVGSLIKGIGNIGEQFFPIRNWDLLKEPDDRIMLMTSNTKLVDMTELVKFLAWLGIPVRGDASLAEVRTALRQSWRIDTVESDMWTKEFLIFIHQMHGLHQDIADKEALIKWVHKVANKIIVVPWERTLSYGMPVTSPGAMFHNVPSMIRGSSAASTMILGTLLNASRAGLNVVGIIMESTEMPAYSNWVRSITNLPVWDSTVVGKCLMHAAPDYDSDKARKKGNNPTLFNTPSFNDCMMKWWDSKMFEPRAGFQKDGSIQHYDSLNLTTDQMDKMTCTGGRPVPGKSVGRLMEQFDMGKFGPKKIAAGCLSVSPCGGRTWQGENCHHDGTFGGDFSFSGCFCPGNCPAGYYCGGREPGYVPGLEGIPGGQYYRYGIHGEKYNQTA